MDWVYFHDDMYVEKGSISEYFEGLVRTKAWIGEKIPNDLEKCFEWKSMTRHYIHEVGQCYNDIFPK